jgi:hypothetical protein
VQTNWHSPSQEEYDWAVQVFLKVFTEYSKKLEDVSKFTATNDEFNKRLLKNLQVLHSAYDGISTFLRFWDNVPLDT